MCSCLFRCKGEAGDYYLIEKSNVCVVCGKEEGYVRKYIVPHEYRKHFPGTKIPFFLIPMRFPQNMFYLQK